MEPYILPLSREYYGITSSKRGSCTRQQSAQHHGTLNLFSTDSGYGGGDAATRPHISPAATARTTVGRRYYNSNQESSNTREFPSSGLRHVQVPTAIETPRGIRAVRNAPAARQNIQVVNVTAAYRDPRQMERPKTGLRCHSAFREGSAGVKESLAYRRPYATSSMCSTPLQSARSVSPVVGRAATPQRRVVDYSAQEKFCQAVRDRAQQRCRGVTDFYVQLSRNMVGNSTPNTPRVASTPTLWSLDAPPVAHQLTLARCHDQLVALTAIPISLMEMADLMWDTTEYRRLCDECATAEELAEVEAAMGEAVVSLRDFSAAFGENSSNTRLAVMKV